MYATQLHTVQSTTDSHQHIHMGRRIQQPVVSIPHAMQLAADHCPQQERKKHHLRPPVN